jgi:hypothetical protein
MPPLTIIKWGTVEVGPKTLKRKRLKIMKRKMKRRMMSSLITEIM